MSVDTVPDLSFDEGFAIIAGWPSNGAPEILSPVQTAPTIDPKLADVLVVRAFIAANAPLIGKSFDEQFQIFLQLVPAALPLASCPMGVATILNIIAHAVGSTAPSDFMPRIH